MEISELLKLRKNKDSKKESSFEVEIEEIDSEEDQKKKKKGMPQGLKLALIAKLKKKHSKDD